MKLDEKEITTFAADSSFKVELRAVSLPSGEEIFVCSEESERDDEIDGVAQLLACVLRLVSALSAEVVKTCGDGGSS